MSRQTERRRAQLAKKGGNTEPDAPTRGLFGKIALWLIPLVAGLMSIHIDPFIGWSLIVLAAVAAIGEKFWHRLSPRPNGIHRIFVFAVAALVVWALVMLAVSRATIKTKVDQEPADVPATAASLNPLAYRLCGQFVNVPGTHRKVLFEIEIDPLNPNPKSVHFDVTRSILIFDGVPSKNDRSGGGNDIVPQAQMTPRSTVDNIKDWIVFDPPRKFTGSPSGTYHYEFKFGPDKNTATRPFVIDGTIATFFNADGSLNGKVYFNPSGDTGVVFDARRCKFYWTEDPNPGEADSPGEVDVYPEQIRMSEQRSRQ